VSAKTVNTVQDLTKLNAAKDAAAAKGWKAQVLNSEGSLPKHAQQLDDLIQRKVDAIIVAMGKPVVLDCISEEQALAPTAWLPGAR